MRQASMLPCMLGRLEDTHWIHMHVHNTAMLNTMHSTWVNRLFASHNNSVKRCRADESFRNKHSHKQSGNARAEMTLRPCAALPICSETL